MGTEATEASNILVTDASPHAGGPATCDRLFETQSDRQETLAVTFDRAPSAWVEAYQQNVGALPEHLAIIAVGETTRSTAAGGSTTTLSTRTGPTVNAVEDPGDLTGVAMRMDDCFERWRQADAETNHRTVCFDSLTTLLQYVDLETAFRFLHVTSRQVAQVDAVAHYHISPEAHDDQTLATVKSLFDAVVEASPAETVSP